MPLENVRVTVYEADGATLAAIYQAATGAAQGPTPESGASGGPNPFITGESGTVEFYADAPDEYVILVEDTVAPARISSQEFTWPALNVEDNSLPGAKIVDDSITTGKIADDAITAAKIAQGAVGSSEIADGNVGTAELANVAVTLAKLGVGAAIRILGIKRCAGGANASHGANTVTDVSSGGLVVAHNNRTYTAIGLLSLLNDGASEGGVAVRLKLDGTQVDTYGVTLPINGIGLFVCVYQGPAANGNHTWTLTAELGNNPTGIFWESGLLAVFEN